MKDEFEVVLEAVRQYILENGGGWTAVSRAKFHNQDGTVSEAYVVHLNRPHPLHVVQLNWSADKKRAVVSELTNVGLLLYNDELTPLNKAVANFNNDDESGYWANIVETRTLDGTILELEDDVIIEGEVVQQMELLEHE